jgi:hypothetical protein
MMTRSERLSPPTAGRLPGLLVAYFPHYLRHFVSQPYRVSGPRAKLGETGRRHHIAMYDAGIDIMLRGYAEAAGCELQPETGQVVVKLMHLGFAFDDELERRTAGDQPLGFDEVFNGHGVRQPLAIWRSFMQNFDTYGPIREFLFSYVTGLYRHHREGTAGEHSAATFDELVAADWDSGGLLVAMAHVVGLLHSAAPSPDLARQFSSLGVTAKLADDMVDLRSDLTGKRPNLLATLATEEGELEQVNAALTDGRRMGVDWWRENCPKSFARLSSVYGQHHEALTSRWLRLANALMWTPAIIGHSSVYDTRGRV